MEPENREDGMGMQNPGEVDNNVETVAEVETTEAVMPEEKVAVAEETVTETATETAPVEKTPEAVAPVAEVKPAGEKVNFLQTILGVVTKPVTTMREHLPKYDNAKNAGILAGIMLAASIVLSTIAAFLNVIFDFSCSSKGGCKAKLDFGYLEYWKFGDFLFNIVLSAVVIMLVVTAVFFGIAKLFKSQKASFWKTLSVVSMAMVPLVVTSFIGSVLGLFSVKFILTVVSVIILAGMIYAIVILYEGMTESAKLEGDKRAYHMIVGSVAALIALRVLIWLIGEKIGLGDMLVLLSL